MQQKFITKKEGAIQALRHAIRIGKYEPGQVLRQNDVASDLGLSSTPVREALIELAATGLLVYEQHRGTRVATVDTHQVEQIYAARRIIETETARIAFSQIDDDAIEHLSELAHQMVRLAKERSYEELVHADEAFHGMIFESCGNPYLIASVRNLWDSFPRYFMWNIDDRIGESMKEHLALVESLKSRNEDKFLRIVSEHLDHGLEAMLKHLGEDREK